MTLEPLTDYSKYKIECELILKKYHSEIAKNPSTSQDDIFTKPDKNKVTGMKQGNYDKLNISLASDLDQLREKWDENPSRYITSVNPDPKGEKIAITARGRVFVVPIKSGRIISQNLYQ